MNISSSSRPCPVWFVSTMFPQVTAQGFDSAFVRCFNYYFAYCEAGFASRTEGCLMLTFSRPGTAALDPNAVTSVITR